MIIVQLGTNTGNDHVLELCKRSTGIEKVILVEPLHWHNETIKKNYNGVENYFIENTVISDKASDSVKFYYTELDGQNDNPIKSYMVSSVIPEHLIKHKYPKESLQTIDVKSITINELFEKYNLSRIEYLFIDIEGVDFDVLKTIDFNKYFIQNIQIEYLHLNMNDLTEFLFSKGYLRGTSLEPQFDIMFTKA